jgi:hypothetical protein
VSVHTGAHQRGLRILTDTNFIPSLHASAFNCSIVLPDNICETPGRRTCRVFPARL